MFVKEQAITEVREWQQAIGWKQPVGNSVCLLKNDGMILQSSFVFGSFSVKSLEMD